MANSYLIDLGISDSLQDVVRKCNQNFRHLASDQSRQNKTGIRQESVRVDNVIKSATSEINAAVKDGLDQIRNEVTQLIKEAQLETIPPIGTYIICDYDPNEKWDNTVWEQIEQIDETPIILPMWYRTY